MKKHNLIKNKILAIFVVAAFANGACSIESTTNSDTGDGTPNNGYNGNGDYTIEYKDQVASGKIDGNDFTAVGGILEVSSFDDTKYSVEIYGQEVSDPCNSFASGDFQVIFSIPQGEGEYELGFDFDDTSNSQTATMLDSSGDIPSNIIASQGAIEIVDLSSDPVTGRLDIYYDDDSYVNGNFELTDCRL